MDIIKKRLIAAAVLISCLAGMIAFRTPSFRGNINKVINKLEGKTLDSTFSTKIKSGNLSTDYTVEEALKDVDMLGLNTLNVPIVVTIDTLSSSDMKVERYSEDRAIELIKKLRGKKVNIILEPYPWINNGAAYETEWKPSDMNMFFWNWKTKVLRKIIDDIAVPYHVDALIIGSNLDNTESYQDKWLDVIEYTRKYYKGLITYKTNKWVTAKWDSKTTEAYEKKLNNDLFSKIDFISVAAYFELTQNDTNTVEDLTKSIQSTQVFDRNQNVKQQLKNFADKYKKPIYFGELGFPRTNRASVEPWNAYQSNILNDSEQARCFEAYRLNFEKESWFLGFSVFAIGERGADKRYFPSEESVQVINKWYGKN